MHANGVGRSARVGQLYRQYGGIIFSRCRRLLRDDALAEDATQEVFVRVLRHLESAPDGEAALAWISRISTNHCLNLLRDRSRRAVASGVDVGEDVPSEHPEAALVGRLLTQQLLERAPPKLSAAAVLTFLDGLEHQQVADALGVSRRTVINRLGEFVAQSRLLLSSQGANASDTPPRAAA